MSRRLNIALLLALRRAAGDRELFERLSWLITLLLWAELSAAAGRNPARAPWMRTSPVARPGAWRARARRSISGRRARG